MISMIFLSIYSAKHELSMTFSCFKLVTMNLHDELKKSSIELVSDSDYGILLNGPNTNAGISVLYLVLYSLIKSLISAIIKLIKI